MNLTLSRLAEGNDPRIQPVDQGPQCQEVESAVGGNFEHGQAERGKVLFAGFDRCDV